MQFMFKKSCARFGSDLHHAEFHFGKVPLRKLQLSLARHRRMRGASLLLVRMMGVAMLLRIRDLRIRRRQPPKVYHTSPWNIQDLDGKDVALVRNQ